MRQLTGNDEITDLLKISKLPMRQLTLAKAKNGTLKVSKLPMRQLTRSLLTVFRT